MKKTAKIIVLIFIIIIILLTAFGIIISRKKAKEYKKSIEGMKITLLGGSNTKEGGGVNSCGYIVRTRNGELIIVDGGRDIDVENIMYYINKYGNGTVNHWYITHLHTDHIGALLSMLNNPEINITIENCYYAVNDREWYIQNNERGLEIELAFFDSIGNSKIKNRVECKKGDIIKMDNISCEIIRITNPNMETTDKENDSSMVFKMTATDVNKSMLFLGDAYKSCTKEFAEEEYKDKLSSYAVQMAHHGQNGVSKKVYELIHPTLCFFNCPEWLWNNDNGGGYNSGSWQTIDVRNWMDEMNTTNFMAFEGNQTIRFTTEGYEKCEE